MLAAAVGAAMTSSAAFATISATTLVVVPTDTGALADDPSLAQYTVYDLKVSISADDHWASQDLYGQLYGNFMYYIPPSLDGNVAPSIANRNGATTKYLRDDTFVGAPGAPGGTNNGFPNGTRPSILGSSSRKTPAPDGIATFPSNGSNFTNPDTGEFEPANSMQLIDVSWGDTGASTNTVTGLVTIARLTVKGTVGQTVDGMPNVGGKIVGNVKSTGSPSTNNFYTFYIPIPEPTSIGLMGLGLGAVALRRRTR